MTANIQLNASQSYKPEIWGSLIKTGKNNPEK